MTRFARSAFAGIGLVAATLVTAVTAQPPEPPPGRPLPPHGDPLRRALDTNGDHELDADEIAKAADSLAKLDANGDGRITREELFPPPPPGFPPRGPGDRERGGPPAPLNEFRGPPREGEPGPPPPRPGETREGGPSPERFVERAMSFDADGDGKLDKAELGRFAEEMMTRMRPPGEGFRRDPAPPGRREPGGGFERPERPRRPEGEGRPERPRRPFGEDDRPPSTGDGERPGPPAGDEAGDKEA